MTGSPLSREADLLEVLRTVEQYFDSPSDWIDAVREAIAKAEGSS